MQWALASLEGVLHWRLAPFGAPSKPSRCCEKRANLCGSFWSLVQLLTRRLPGFPALQLHDSPAQVPGAGPARG